MQEEIEKIKKMYKFVLKHNNLFTFNELVCLLEINFSQLDNKKLIKFIDKKKMDMQKECEESEFILINNIKSILDIMCNDFKKNGYNKILYKKLISIYVIALEIRSKLE